MIRPVAVRLDGESGARDGETELTEGTPDGI
jgi:hypothetical protein